ncbi:hypothetical protein [Roseateles koreensis]|uniref:Uncharacterized protein n=1 Tax=Roseateles koreensis TaxID=2987526 RepID=A0ABT5KXA2_9BURK|nr:hypothetical protein [Roseateles koreensis]MDC8786456.1 hypothetical protein [Roseateles koreensis]
MNNKLFAALLVSTGLVSVAQAAAPSADAEVQALRNECAAASSVKLGAAPKQDNEFHFVYYKGDYRGEQKAGRKLACTESQYAAYLDKTDPVRVMGAYPTAAGRPSAKPAKPAESTETK